MSRFYRTAETGQRDPATRSTRDMLRQKAQSSDSVKAIIPAKPSKTEMVTLRVPGLDRLVRINRGELVRRAMSAAVAKRTMELVRHHHVTEAGRRITLEPQWEQIYADPSPDMRLIAPAQRGKTTYQIVKTMAQLSLGLAVGWVLPKENKINELEHAKLAGTIRNTELYRRMMEEGGGNNTVKYKEFGPFGKLYLVTANSPTELTSFSSDAMHVDERDFCNLAHLPMYPSRMNASDYQLTDEISTPTVEGTRVRMGQKGIDNIHSEFLLGDQYRYTVICPHCGMPQVCDWYDNVVRTENDDAGRILKFDVRDKDWSPGAPQDIRVCCRACDRPFDRLTPGSWVHHGRGSAIRSYWVEALNLSMGPSLATMLATFQKALGNPTKLQAFTNLDLGRTFSGGAMRFSDEMFQRCTDEQLHIARSSDGPCTMGIDVNRPLLDVHISRWLEGRQFKVWCGKLQGGQEEILKLVRRYQVVAVVIDHDPETKFSMSLQESIQEATSGRCIVTRCRYATNQQSKPVVVSEAGDNPEIDPPRLVSVDRTVAIDNLFESMQTGAVRWFAEWRSALDGDLVTEFSNPTRKLITSESGREKFVWEGEPDHQLHAAVYDQLAGEIRQMNRVSDMSEIGPLVSHMSHSSGVQAPFDNRLMILLA